MDKDRLKQLIEKNKLFVKRKKWKENELLQDCIKSLNNVELLENDEQIHQTISSIYERFSVKAFQQQVNICEMNK